MGRRYYCDYCDKTFIDDVDARKKHLNSLQHVKIRKLHYDSCRDLKTLFKEERAKEPCRRFLTKGCCQFDSICKYTHYTVEQLFSIEQQIAYLESIKNKEVPAEIPDVDTWLIKHASKSGKETEVVNWIYPEHFKHRFDLPPSLQKFKLEEFNDSDYDNWG